jgi:hypothetical protein
LVSSSSNIIDGEGSESGDELNEGLESRCSFAAGVKSAFRGLSGDEGRRTCGLEVCDGWERAGWGGSSSDRERFGRVKTLKKSVMFLAMIYQDGGE